jgi:hypothetical protein
MRSDEQPISTALAIRLQDRRALFIGISPVLGKTVRQRDAFAFVRKNELRTVSIQLGRATVPDARPALALGKERLPLRTVS